MQTLLVINFFDPNEIFYKSKCSFHSTEACSLSALTLNRHNFARDVKIAYFVLICLFMPRADEVQQRPLFANFIIKAVKFGIWLLIKQGDQYRFSIRATRNSEDLRRAL
jgi:hypothetical protein